MTRTALMVLALSSALSAQTTPPASSTTAARKGALTHKRIVHVQAVPKAALPKATTLVNTAQSGATRSSKPVKMLPASSLAASTGPNEAASQKGHWILLYRSAECIPCDRLMNALSSVGDSGNANLSRVTIMVGKPQPELWRSVSKVANSRPAGHTPVVAPNASEQQNEVNTLRSKFATMDRATWAYDKGGDVYMALKPSGSPTMYGMDGQHIIWRSAGMPGGPAAVQQSVTSWLNSKSLSELATPETSAPPASRQ